MTETKRLMTVAATLLLVLSVPGAMWSLAGANGGQVAAQQADTGPSFNVSNISAPPSATAGDVITVSATVTYEAAGAATETATATETETAVADEETETPAGTETAAGTETETEMGVQQDTETATAQATETPIADDETETETAAGTETATAGGPVTETVEYRIDGELVARQNVTLEPGESTTVTFRVDTTGLEPGIYIHSILTGQSGEDASIFIEPEVTGPVQTETPTGTETPVAGGEETETPIGGEETETEMGVQEDTETATAQATEEPATGEVVGINDLQLNQTSFQVDNISAPASATVGDTLEVSANISYDPEDINANETTQQVEFRIDGDVVATQNVTLEPGESTNVTFEVDTTGLEPDIYTYGVLTQAHGEMGVIQLTEETTETPGGTETPVGGEETETPIGGEETETPVGGEETETETET